MADPNSQNQLWSAWKFRIYEAGRHVGKTAVEYNAAKWMRQAFGTAGRLRVLMTLTGWEIQLVVEGKPAHDSQMVAQVRKQFANDFVRKGWGPLAMSSVEAQVLAGSKQDGRPAPQMVELPTIERGS